MGETERGETAPSIRVTFWCSNAHMTRPAFALEAPVPELWDCPRCGWPAGRDRDNTPPEPRNEPYKTHLAYARERRNPADSEVILAEALAKLRNG